MAIAYYDYTGWLVVADLARVVGRFRRLIDIPFERYEIAWPLAELHPGLRHA